MLICLIEGRNTPPPPLSLSLSFFSWGANSLSLSLSLFFFSWGANVPSDPLWIRHWPSWDFDRHILFFLDSRPVIIYVHSFSHVMFLRKIKFIDSLVGYYAIQPPSNLDYRSKTYLTRCECNP